MKISSIIAKKHPEKEEESIEEPIVVKENQS